MMARTQIAIKRNLPYEINALRFRLRRISKGELVSYIRLGNLKPPEGGFRFWKSSPAGLAEALVKRAGRLRNEGFEILKAEA